MKNSKSKRKSLRRQWSVDMPSSIQKKFREVTASRRSKSLDEEYYKQKLLDNEKTYDKTCGERKNYGSFENFGQVHSDPPQLTDSCGSSPFHSFEEDNSQDSLTENEAQDVTQIGDIQIEVKREKAPSSMRTKDILSVNTCGLLSTIDELVPRSPTKRTSPAAEFDHSQNKIGNNDVPARKFAKNEEATRVSSDEEPEIGERYRRYAICEEMERYIICDHKGLSLRKYRETLIRHRVLKELCLL